MTWVNRLAALVILVIGAAQAWDSGALGAGAAVIAMVAASILLLAIAPLMQRTTLTRVGPVVASGVLLLLARMVSDVPLPELMLAGFLGWVFLLVIEPSVLAQRRSV